MGAARPKTPKHHEIVEAQKELITQLPHVRELLDGTEWGLEQLECTCWACGNGGPGRITRCHINAFSKGGSQGPDNFFLLCDPCHWEQPDGLPKELQIAWIKSREHWIPKYWRITGAIVLEIKGSVPGASWSDLDAWHQVKRDQITNIIRSGYESAASFLTGRSNATALLADDFRSWMSTRTISDAVPIAVSSRPPRSD